jgi:hypothetical protein
MKRNMAHSSIIGGSTAGRLLNCPASHHAIIALPPSAETPSEYAEEGTAMHAVMQAIMTDRMRGNASRLSDWLGNNTFHDRVLTREHIEHMIEPALAALSDLERVCGGGFNVIGCEVSVRFPGIVGAFGTVDLILQSQSHVLHVDWKFGQGIGVKAIYEDENGALLNPQLMFYTAAARHSRPAWYRGKRKIVAAIIQPRSETSLSFAWIAPQDIKDFIADVHNAVALAIGREPPRVRGEHCRFAPCKITCPLWTGPLLNLNDLRPPPIREIPTADCAIATPYGIYLAHAKALLDSAAMLKKTIDEQLHAYLESGGKVPGWKLKAKTKARQWIDEPIVYETLKALGFSEYEIWAPRKLATFTAAEAVARKLNVRIPDDLRLAPSSNETTIATTDDPAPAVEPQLLMDQFTAALKQLTENRL